jgi:hypothetical protein
MIDRPRGLGSATWIDARSSRGRASQRTRGGASGPRLFLAALLLALTGYGPACDTPSLPGFATPPPYDGGSSDEDAGPDAVRR